MAWTADHKPVPQTRHGNTSRRSGLPPPIERYDLPHPAVPPAFDGLRVLQLTDLHIRAARPYAREPRNPRACRKLADAIETLDRSEHRPDLVLVTGDLAHQEEDAIAAVEVLRGLLARIRPRTPVVGVLGNHDHPAVLHALAGRPPPTLPEGLDPDSLPTPAPLDRLCLLDPARAQASCELHLPGRGTLRLVGSSEPEDLLAADLEAEQHTTDADDQPLTIAVVHQPTQLFCAQHLGIPIVFAGHTHGGQFRLWPGRSFHTSSDLPGRLACGILRLGQTLCCVSRGLGESAVRLRINCPRQAPLITLQRAELPGEPSDVLPTLATVW